MKQQSKSSLFLIELIIAILFFSTCSAVCVQLFAKSHTTSLESQYRGNAVLEAETLLETYRNGGGDIEGILDMTGATATEIDGTYTVYSNLNGDYSNEEGSFDYIIVMTLATAEGEIDTFTVEIYPPRYDTAIISYSTKVYQQNIAT